MSHQPNQPEQLLPVSQAVSSVSIHDYAELTQDFNPIHLDPEFARGTPMGGVIAHGTFCLNLLWQSLERTFGGTRALVGGNLEVRFVKPVYIGDCVTAQGQRVRRAEDDCYEVWVTNTAGVKVISGIFRPATSERA